MLADINAAIAVLGALVNTYLNIKRMHVAPLVKNYEENQEKHVANRARRIGIGGSPPMVEISYQLYLKQFHCPKLDFDVALDRIVFLAERGPEVIPILIQAKRSVGEVTHAFKVWNEVAEKLFKLQNQEERQIFYFGLPTPDGITNSYFPDTIRNLEVCVNDALAFSSMAIKGIQKTSLKVIPRWMWWMRKRVSNFKIEDPEHRALMPSDEYKKEWAV